VPIRNTLSGADCLEQISLRCANEKFSMSTSWCTHYQVSAKHLHAFVKQPHRDRRGKLDGKRAQWQRQHCIKYLVDLNSLAGKSRLNAPLRRIGVTALATSVSKTFKNKQARLAHSNTVQALHFGQEPPSKRNSVHLRPPIFVPNLTQHRTHDFTVLETPFPTLQQHEICRNE
jgi:hypothetical protein